MATIEELEKQLNTARDAEGDAWEKYNNKCTELRKMAAERDNALDALRRVVKLHNELITAQNKYDAALADIQKFI